MLIPRLKIPPVLPHGTENDIHTSCRGRQRADLCPQLWLPSPHSPLTATSSLCFSTHHTHNHLLDLYLLWPLPGTFFSQIYKTRINIQTVASQRGLHWPACVPGTHCPIALFHLCPRMYHCPNSHIIFVNITGSQFFSWNIMYSPWEQLTCSYSPLWPQLLDLCLDHNYLKKCLWSECQISFSFLREECLGGQNAQVADHVCKENSYDKFLKECRNILLPLCFMQYQPYFSG